MSELVIDRISELAGERPARWLGHHGIVEIFNADVEAQHAAMHAFCQRRAELEELAGTQLSLVFHTSLESSRLYSSFLRKWGSEPHLLVHRSIRLPCYDLPAVEGMTTPLRASSKK